MTSVDLMAAFIAVYIYIQVKSRTMSTEFPIVDVTASTRPQLTAVDGTVPAAAVNDATAENHSDQDDYMSQGWIMARRLEPMMRDVMDGYLYNVPYQSHRCGRLAKDICEVIKVNMRVAVTAWCLNSFSLRSLNIVT